MTVLEVIIFILFGIIAVRNYIMVGAMNVSIAAQALIAFLALFALIFKAYRDAKHEKIRDKKEHREEIVFEQKVEKTIQKEQKSEEKEDLFLQLEKLNELKNNGIITEEDFKKKKDEILARM